MDIRRPEGSGEGFERALRALIGERSGEASCLLVSNPVRSRTRSGRRNGWIHSDRPLAQPIRLG